MFDRPFAARVSAALCSIFLIPAAFAAHLHVENNGLDTNTCGAGDPCRSIGMAIQRASAGDVILVGPGIYGDVNQNGTLGEPGEETGEIGFGCNCLVKVDKAVTILSTGGAQVTRIDARSIYTANTLTYGVHITADNVVFGARDRGFRISAGSNFGVFIESAHAKVSGNLTTGPGGGFWAGGQSNELDSDLAVSDGEGFLITEANNTVTRSVASGTRDFGFVVSRGSVRSGPTGIVLSHDVSIGNQQGFNILGSANLDKVAAIGNLGGGIVLRSGAIVNVTNSNIYGNGVAGGCGVINQSEGSTVVISNSFWGAPAGPGSAPADSVCDDDGTTTLVPSVAPHAFYISPDP